jgi:hypothetical protein
MMSEADQRHPCPHCRGTETVYLGGTFVSGMVRHRCLLCRKSFIVKADDRSRRLVKDHPPRVRRRTGN